MTLRRELRSSAIGVAGSRALGGIGGIVSARLLGPAGKGELAVLIVVATIVGTAGTLGLQFWIATATARGERGVTAVLRRHVVTTTAIVAALATMALALRDSLGLGSGEVLAAAAFVEAWVVSMLALAVANGERRMDLVAAGTIAGGVAYVAVLVVLGATGHTTVTSVLAAGALANAVPVAACVPSLRRARAKSGPDAYATALRVGVPGMVGELLTYATFRVDVALVAAFRPAVEVGAYAVASALAELVLVVPDALAQVVLPRAAAALDGARRLLVLSGWSMVLAAVALAAVAGPVVSLAFGSRFAPAVTPLRWLLPGVVAIGAWKVLGAEVAGRGSTKPRATSALVGLVVLVAGDVVWLSRGGGIVGAAVISSVAYAASAGAIALGWARLPVAAGGR